MEKERSFKDLLALCFKRWKVLIIGMIFGSFLMGYVQYGIQMEIKNDPENSEAAVEARYQELLKEYNSEIGLMNSTIAADERTIKTSQEYVDNSLLMLIDPYNKYTTIVDVAIEIADDDVYTQNFGYSTTPVDYIVTKVLNQYMAAYNSEDISKLDDLQRLHENLPRKYWNEVVSLEIEEGGIVEIKGVGATEEESKAIVNALYAFLESKTEVISKASYEHAFVVVTESTKVEIDSWIEEVQNTKRNAISNAQREIEDLTRQKNALAVPEREIVFDIGVMKAEIKKFAIIGIGVGLIVAMIYIMLHAIAVGMVITSEEIIRNCKITYMGALTRGDDKRAPLCKRLSDCISGERIWNNREDSIEYIVESIVSLVPGDNVLLSSTTRVTKDAGITALVEALEEKKKKVTVLLEAPKNAKFYAAVQENDVIVFLESPVKSRMNEIELMNETCKNWTKALVGFVLLTK